MAKTKKDTATKTDKTTDATTADVKTTVEVVEAQDVIMPVVENSVETVEETKEAPATDISEVPAEEATKKPKTKTKRSTKAKTTKTPKKAPKETKKKVAINGVVPLNGPTTIYRGPGVYPFAKINGIVKLLEDTNETGYAKVQCVISGFGACTGYVKL